MKDIRILELVLENFKCHSFLRLNFGGRNAWISGDNGAGKTSVYDAFVWLLWGGDSAGNGDKLIEVKPLDADGRADSGEITSVECTLLVDGTPVRFRRAYREVWSGEQVFGGHTSEYAVDNVPCRKQEYLRRVEELAGEEAFRVLGNVRYFAQELDWQRRRELLCRAAGLPGDRELMAEEPEFAEIPEQMGEKTLDEYRKWLVAQVKELTRAGNDLPARISECENTLRQVEGLDFGQAQARFADLKGRKDILTARLIDPAAGADRARVESIRQRRDSLLRENRHYQDALQDVENRRQALRERVFRGDVCASCGQDLPAYRVNLAREAFRQELRREAEALDSRQARLRREAVRAKEALGAVEEELKQMERELPEDNGEELRRELKALAGEMERLQQILDRQALKTYAEQRLEQLQQQAQKAEALLQMYQQRLNALDRFGRFRASRLEESVNALFEQVRFRLFREKVGGGLEERCDVTVAGVPYLNVNSAGKVRAGMDIIRVMAQVWGVRLPLFLDNAEGVTALPETACQRIALRVAPGPLKLEREGEGVWEADPFGRCM